MDLMLAQVNQMPSPPSIYQRGIPADLEAIVMRCLAKDPDQRIASASELDQELKGCQSAGEWSQEDAKRWWDGQGAV